MLIAFATGFFLGISLIFAIGAQNVFVLRHGILQQHVFYIALFCAISDAALITLGVTGISYFFNNFVDKFSSLLFGISSIWLSCYGIIRLMGVFKSNSAKTEPSPSSFETFGISNSTSVFVAIASLFSRGPNS